MFKCKGFFFGIAMFLCAWRKFGFVLGVISALVANEQKLLAEDDRRAGGGRRSLSTSEGRVLLVKNVLAVSLSTAWTFYSAHYRAGGGVCVV